MDHNVTHALPRRRLILFISHTHFFAFSFLTPHSQQNKVKMQFSQRLPIILSVCASKLYKNKKYDVGRRLPRILDLSLLVIFCFIKARGDNYIKRRLSICTIFKILFKLQTSFTKEIAYWRLE